MKAAPPPPPTLMQIKSSLIFHSASLRADGAGVKNKNCLLTASVFLQSTNDDLTGL